MLSCPQFYAIFSFPLWIFFRKQYKSFKFLWVFRWKKFPVTLDTALPGILWKRSSKNVSKFKGNFLPWSLFFSLVGKFWGDIFFQEVFFYLCAGTTNRTIWWVGESTCWICFLFFATLRWGSEMAESWYTKQPRRSTSSAILFSSGWCLQSIRENKWSKSVYNLNLLKV